MTDNIVDFPKHHQTADLAEPVSPEAKNPLTTIIEHEHEVFELRMTVADMAVELYRYRQRLGEVA